MLAKTLLQRMQQPNPMRTWHAMTSISTRSFARAAMAANTTDVKLKGKMIKGRQADLPTMIWLPEITEPAANFESFFTTRRNRVLDVRNVVLLDYRNQGESDHHESYDMNVSFSIRNNQLFVSGNER